MNHTQKIRIIYFIIVLLMFAVTIAAMFYLPNEITVHWSSSGKQTGSKFLVFVVPVIALVTWLGTPAFLSKKADKNAGQISLYNKILIFGLIPVLACLNVIWILNA